MSFSATLGSSRRKVIAALAIAALVAVSVAGTAVKPALASGTGAITWDFESGSAQGWTVVSGGFGQLVTDRAFEHNSSSTPYSKQGTWYMSTLESPTQAPNDGYTGEVDSPSFVLALPQITLLVSGGNSATTYLGVVNASGTVLATAQGNNSETMVRRSLDLTPFLGQTVHLALVDQSTSAWGHIDIDDIHVNQPTSTTWDFETGTAQGWNVVSGSFGQLITNRAFEHNAPTTPYTKQGTWYMSTLESPTQAPNDSYTGEVDSPSFVLTAPSINLLVDGGNSASTYLGVANSSGTVLAKAQGNNSEKMIRRSLDLTQYLGQTLHLVLVDQSTGAWGHIDIDDIHVNSPAPLSFDFEDGTLQGWQVTSGSFGQLVSDRDLQANAPTLPYTKQGAFYLSTLDTANLGVNDGFTGQLVSPSFLVGQPQMQLMIGGGSGPGEYVALETQANVQIWSGHGQNSEVMVPFIVDLTAYVGQVLHLRVVDNSTGGWGHVTLDNVRINQIAPIGIVPDLASTHDSSGSVKVQWTPPVSTALAGYSVYRSDLSSSTASNPAGTPSFLATVSSNAIDYTDTSASASGSYIYSVRAMDASNTQYAPAYTVARAYKDLNARGATTVYSGSTLAAIRFPVGPLGDGGIVHDGTGQRINWQNLYPADNVTSPAAPLPDTFFAVRSGSGAVAALQTAAAGAFQPAPALTMTGEYPMGAYHFSSPVSGVDVTESFDSPMVPGDTKDSSIPVAVYTFTVKNTSTSSQTISILAAQQNAAGWDGISAIGGTSYSGYGSNTNTVQSIPGGTAIQMSKSGSTTSLRLSTTSSGATATASWTSSASLLSAFQANASLSGPTTATSASGLTVDAALASSVTLAPGSSASIPVVLRWWDPTASHQGGLYTGRYYTTLWGSTSTLDAYIDAHLTDAQSLTKLYHDTLYSSNLPQYVLDRASSGAALLHTPTVYWSSAGVFGGYEGYGCCDGMPPHVWEYNQGMPQLFPDVGVKVVDQWLDSINADGHLGERPLSSTTNGSAFDGQAGVILGAYREYESFPTAAQAKTWLDSEWPHIKAATDWLWQTYDPGRTGLTTGATHNTLDTDFNGTDSWTGSMYLASANAASRLATAEGDSTESTLLSTLYSTGSANQNAYLWNGQYYRDVDASNGVYQSYGNGVAGDMLLGQWWSSLLAFGSIYPSDRETQSLRTLYRDNEKNNFIGYNHVWRSFVAPTDSALTMFSWPHGDQPSNSVNYFDETMSGFEYATAATMIQNGLVNQGLSMMNSANDRYDGVLRTSGISGGGCGAYYGGTGNPFGDDECGAWYGRSGSSWSIVEALQGLTYTGASQKIAFAPTFQPANHASFFTAGNSWGLFSQNQSSNHQTDTISVSYGSLPLQHLSFVLPAAASSAIVTVNGTTVGSSMRVSGPNTLVDLTAVSTIGANDSVVVAFTE